MTMMKMKRCSHVDLHDGVMLCDALLHILPSPQQSWEFNQKVGTPLSESYKDDTMLGMV